MSQRTIQQIPQHQESEILSQFVEALISAQDELDGSRPGEWSEILREACRQQKVWSDEPSPDHELLAVN